MHFLNFLNLLLYIYLINVFPLLFKVCSVGGRILLQYKALHKLKICNLFKNINPHLFCTLCDSKTTSLYIWELTSKNKNNEFWSFFNEQIRNLIFSQKFYGKLVTFTSHLKKHKLERTSSLNSNNKKWIITIRFRNVTSKKKKNQLLHLNP